jgi:hypothetical protein
MIALEHAVYWAVLFFGGLGALYTIIYMIANIIRDWNS